MSSKQTASSGRGRVQGAPSGKEHKILWGICGIGLGHALRQLPLVEYFARNSRIVIFAYGDSATFYKKWAEDRKNITVVTVSVPYYVGAAGGLDFEETERQMRECRFSRGENWGEGHNCLAMAHARREIGTPDLVVTDYEPICARYAYALGAPLVSLNQQNKYLIPSTFPEIMGGVGFKDEVERLRMFFPRVDAHIACSFFDVQPRTGAALREQVLMFPPIIKSSVVAAKCGGLKPNRSIVVYLSGQQEFPDSLCQIRDVCNSQPEWLFHVFAPESFFHKQGWPPVGSAHNVTFSVHGNAGFDERVFASAGVVTTGGHSLLSELMYLGKPAYVIPLPVYEQQMNAYVIGENGFGLRRQALTAEDLSLFLRHLPGYTSAIENDRTVLLRSSGGQRIIDYLKERFLS